MVLPLGHSWTCLRDLSISGDHKGAYDTLYSYYCILRRSRQHRWYVFDPESLHQLAQAAIAASPSPDDTAFMVNYISKNLTETYPSTQIALNHNTSEWVFNNAGGAMGAMYIIHASITEYLIIFGTPLGTEGHTGIHTADDYFNILVGEQWAFAPPNLAMERYPPGSVHHLPRGQMKQYKMHEGCFALEYARGALYVDLLVDLVLIPVVSFRMDPAHAAVWSCGYALVNARLRILLPYRSDYWTRDV
jgi:C-8 sterol isomerase